MQNIPNRYALIRTNYETLRNKRDAAYKIATSLIYQPNLSGSIYLTILPMPSEVTFK